MDKQVIINLKDIIDTLNKTSNQKSKPIFITASGTYIGDICEISTNPIKENSKQVDLSYIVKDNKDVCINLENVIFNPQSNPNCTINYPQLIIFLNQIISISFTQV